MAQVFHPLLALIASATDRELAKYVESSSSTDVIEGNLWPDKDLSSANPIENYRD